METEALRKRLNSALEVEDWNVRNEYKSVSVLILYWQEGDVPGFEVEARQIGELFASTFHFNVEYYGIPSSNSLIRLDGKINSFLADHGDPDHLIIIHYGGHGDPDDENGQPRLAVWAAQSHDGPTADWSIIQPKLGHVKAEILLLLDCCFAAQAARANQNRAIPANVELVAACAMGVKTRLPGPHSFTTHLIEQLRASLNSTGSAKISEIVNSLAYRDSEYSETPVHFSGLGNGKSTVCLEPFDANPASELDARREAAWLTLKVSLRDVLSDTLISDIIRWLKARPTRKVSRLTIENVVQSANNFGHFIHDEGRDRTSGPKFSQLPASAKHDVLAAWNDFGSLLATLGTQLKVRYSLEGGATQVQGTGSDHVNDVLRGPLASLLELEHGILSLQGIVQRSVMALPDLYGNRESLREAIRDTAMQDLGLVPLLDRRLKARFPSDAGNSLKTDHTITAAPTELKVFRSLVKEEHRGLGPVLVEYKSYDKQTLPAGRTKRLEQQIQTLADLLQTCGPPEFCTLRCTGWFHEEENTRLGLMFEYPVGYDGSLLF